MDARLIIFKGNFGGSGYKDANEALEYLNEYGYIVGLPDSIFNWAWMYHNDIPHHILLNFRSSLRVDREIPFIQDLRTRSSLALLFLQIDVEYYDNETHSSQLYKREGWLGVDTVIPEHKTLLDAFPDVPYIVWVTGHDTPNAMTDDQLRQRWKEETGHDDITILHFSGTENFRIDGLDK